MGLKKQIASFFLGASIAFGTGSVVVTTPTPAYAQDNDEEPRRRRSETLDPAVARVLQEVFTAIQEERFQDARAQVNQLLAQRGDRMKAFDKSTTYEILGTIQVNLANYRGALQAFKSALSANGLPPERNNQLRFFIAQIYFQLEDYQQAIRGLNEWIRAAQAAGETVDANAYYLLAAAYIQIEPANYRAAMPNAERVLQLRGSENKKSDYDLLNLIYSELSEDTKRGVLLERIINIFPGEKAYWVQLSGLYNTTGRDKEAFAVLEVAYRAGLLDKEAEIITLVNYYSFNENPYRGATLLEREMAAGRVERDLDNLILLSQLFSQSREHKRAIPVLREAAGLSDKGELSYRLGQVLLADEQYASAERALTTALNKGGMKSDQTGDAWLLLGTARFSQAGPGDRATRARARAAFRNATRYERSRRQAIDWITYLNAIDTTEDAQDRLERQQNIEAAEDNIERLRTQLQVCRLQGDGNCDEFETRIAEEQEKLRTLKGGEGDDEAAEG